MASIFDSISGDIQDFGSALSGLLSGTGAVKGSSTQDLNNSALTSSFLMERRLSTGVSPLNANPYPGEYKVTPGQQSQQVDSETVNKQWLQRLNLYSQMPQVEGAKRK